MSSLIPRVVRRATNLIDIEIKNIPGVARFGVLGHYTLNGAYQTPELIFAVDSGTIYRSTSQTILNCPTYSHPDSLKFGFRALFDLNDFSLPTNDIPLDSQYCFLRIATLDATDTVVDIGPILVILPTVSKGNQYPTLSIGGTVPSFPDADLGIKAPPDCLIIALGGQGHQINIENYDDADDIFVSFEESEGMIKIVPGKDKDLKASRTGLVYLCTDGSDPIEFSLYAALLSD